MIKVKTVIEMARWVHHNKDNQITVVNHQEILYQIQDLVVKIWWALVKRSYITNVNRVSMLLLNNNKLMR